MADADKARASMARTSSVASGSPTPTARAWIARAWKGRNGLACQARVDGRAEPGRQAIDALAALERAQHDRARRSEAPGPTASCKRQPAKSRAIATIASIPTGAAAEHDRGAAGLACPCKAADASVHSPLAFRKLAATVRGSFLSTSTWRLSSCIVGLSSAAPTFSSIATIFSLAGDLRPHDGCQEIGREQRLVVVECDEFLGRDLPVGREAVGDLDLLLVQRLVAQAQCGELLELGELRPVDLLQPSDAVAPIDELGAGAEPELGRGLAEIAQGLEVELLGGLGPTTIA
jgi:hypothetical protein